MESNTDLECRKRCAAYRAAITDLVDYADVTPFTDIEYATIVVPYIKVGHGSTLNDEKHLERLLLLVARRIYDGHLEAEQFVCGRGY